MKKLLNFSQKYPLVVILILLGGIVFSLLNVGKVWMDTSSESMMMHDDPDLAYYRETLDKFGSDSMVMIYVKDENLFTVEKLKIVEALMMDLSDESLVPGIQRVESLYSVNNIKGYPDYLDNNPLMDYPPETQEEADLIKSNATSNSIFVGNLISADGKKTVINLYLKPVEPGDRDSASKTQAGVVKLLYGEDGKSGYQTKFDTLFEIGDPYIRSTLSDLIVTDMTTLMPISFGILMLMLIITIGSFSGAILPFITSSLSILFTFGFMGVMDLPLNILTFIIPILVIVIGSTEDVHILAEYQEGLLHEGSRKLAIRYMAKVIGTALFLTSLTTFLGFLSISLNKVIVLIQFGMIAGFALFINPLTTCLVSPVYLSIFGAKAIIKKKKKKGFLTRLLDSMASWLVEIIKKYKTAVLILLLGAAAILGFFSTRIQVDNDTVSYFKEDSQIINRMQIMHEELSGGQTFFVRINREQSAEKIAAVETGEEISIEIDENAFLSGDEDDILIDDSIGDGEILIDESTGPDEIIIDDSSFDDEILIDESTGPDEIMIDDSSFDDEILIDESTGPDEIMIDDFEDATLVEAAPVTAPASRAAISNINLFKDPRYLRLVADVQFKLDSQFNFDKTISIATYIQMMHREMNIGQPGNFDITPDPSDPLSGDLIAQYALNLHHDQISTFITPDWSEANILVRHNITSSGEVQKVIERLNKVLAAELMKVDPYLKFKVTGGNILVNKAADSIATSQVTGLILLLFVILIIMSVLFTNIKAGLLSLIPNIFPIAVYLGIMGIFNIPLNMGTCMVAAIAIGISVDDTIHFMTRYNYEMRKFQDRDKAIEAVIHAEIKPIISTSTALALGFIILAGSNLIPILYFGILSAIVMVCALLADLLITPILLSSVQLTNISELAGLKLAEDLKTTPLFEGMSMWQIKKFALMGLVLEKEAGEHIIQTGETDRNMYILLSGKVYVERFDVETNTHTKVATLGVGSVIGEIALLRACPRTANVVAAESISYLKIDWNGLVRIQKASKSISLKLYRNMAKILGQRLVNMNDLIEKQKELV